MKLFSIEGNTQKLDGGAMFGNAPRMMWQSWYPPDEKNRIHLACRSLLLQSEGGINVLFDVGIGVFFEPKLRDRFGVVEEEHLLLKNLAAQGLKEEDIDYIVLSHLHFDHAGGLLSPYEEGPLRLLFPKAKIYVGKEHWQRATNPHPRDRASFIPELHRLLEESGRFFLIEGEEESSLPFPVRFEYVHGHTPGLMLARLSLRQGPLLFVADLTPGLPWLHLPISMGYDRFPELVIEEKQRILPALADEGGFVFFTHDINTPCAQVLCNEKGKYYGEAVEITEL